MFACLNKHLLIQCLLLRMSSPVFAVRLSFIEFCIKVLTFLLQNHWPNFNQTWHKISRGSVVQNVQMKDMLFAKGRYFLFFLLSIKLIFLDSHCVITRMVSFDNLNNAR